MSLDNPLIGIVLCGGESLRMGEDKSKIIYHNDIQAIHMLTLLNQTCTKAYLSVRKYTGELKYPQIQDSYDFAGPINGIISALKNFPGNSILITTTDMPALDYQMIQLLVKSHTLPYIVTCYAINNNPEPFPSIWNPNTFQLLLKQAESGNFSPLFFLKNNDANFIKTEATEKLININTPQERKQYLKNYSFEN